MCEPSHYRACNCILIQGILNLRAIYALVRAYHLQSHSLSLGVSLFGFILLGTLCGSYTWISVSFFRVRNFSAVISSNIYFLKLFILFYFWLHWVFVAALRLPLVVARGPGYSSLQCTGFSFWWLLLLQSMDSRCVGFSRCGTCAQ